MGIHQNVSLVRHSQCWGVEVLEGSIAVGEAFWGKEMMKIILFTPIRGTSREEGYEWGLFVRFQTSPGPS